ncbi:hypothetical protein FK949_gp068 [Paramecium bursaria Chlorella virus NYs1]|uniref:Uncharacterized protein n=1 Tax=Paramecium bursaria Chlorella virus NYs1 TaxID=83442 RepID=M1HH75_9PHYC|nr:hypothetical protein AR158_C180L [Paramecium bursaria Chlorella virus AR158]YP_009665278.1 hypothetical protein FK949_gp068 [Paramecium bursaria Chlorella virus NYs1]ABU43726.1 hypothetical protein AR158_C180L [Paramecium bursaria Chlorella virus AR158]AGE54094.1 hypothetical protein PBCVIL52s1_075L [Paramecium bursaria Chlorella virus IL-5-2s1]AGE58633.1 hypothetical protein PBCVNYs1_195L [Paramecium bursaria Chlorella virus NYs1]
MNLIYIVSIVSIVAIIIVLTWFFMRKERWSDYNAPNDFMKIYYSNIVEDSKLAKKYPFFGIGNFAGLRCAKPNNKGCNTIWISGKLVERTPELDKRLKCRFGI